MKKSCQLYNLLFCKEDIYLRCTIIVARVSICTKVRHCFGAFQCSQQTEGY
ncbi:reductase [Lelliottia amnigena]|nr:reductase [Lelliottia amnigena]